MGRLSDFIKAHGPAPPLVHDTNCDRSPAHFTEEGYLIDTPRVTRVGVFFYPDKPKGVQRQLRLPEEVFNPESLASYKGKPVIITHNAGEVTADTIDEAAPVGAIMSDGREAGEYVEAEIVIHEPDRINGMRELSLGYALDLEKKPGTWNGESYDCIQRNIRINHLALVDEARAGDKSRLNIDSRNKTEGDVTMAKNRAKKRNNLDSAVAALVEAVEAVTEEQADDLPEAVVADETGEDNPLDEALEAAAGAENEDEEPETLEAAVLVIKALKEELATLKGDVQQDEAEPIGEALEAAAGAENEDEDAEDEAEEDEAEMNADGVSRILAEQTALVRMGERLGVRGIASMNPKQAKKAILRKTNPGLNTDGISNDALNVAVLMAAEGLRKTTDAQRKKIMNRDGATVTTGMSSSEQARAELIERNRRG